MRIPDLATSHAEHRPDGLNCTTCSHPGCVDGASPTVAEREHEHEHEHEHEQ